MRTAVIGGGAAGFFAAVNLKEMMPEMQVDIFEGGRRVLAKVAVSGGGRCNCTNSFASVKDLSQVYPRGHRLLKRLFNVFDHEDAYAWIERRGVPLVTQEDECVFPRSQDAHSIINLFLSEARRLGVSVYTERRIASLDELSDYDYVVVATGGCPRKEGLQWLVDVGQAVVNPCPSLFTFNIDDAGLRALMGTVVETATAQLAGTKFKAAGPLLVTHWGVSGPAILKLSSHAARWLAEHDYHAQLSVNWLSMNDEALRQELDQMKAVHAQKLMPNVRPLNLSSRLWNHLLEKASLTGMRWGELGGKSMNRLVNVLANDTYTVSGRGIHKDEFVTCGGVALEGVNPVTLESRVRPGLYFAGEVLDIDGVTGGFNFQAAWTTGFVVATAIQAEGRGRPEADG